MLNVQRLRLLRELYLRGSLAAVADALWLTPSAVSQQLAALERETKLELFSRVGRGVELTPAGRALAESAQSVLSDLEVTERLVSSLAASPGGRVRVAVVPSLVQRFAQAQATPDLAFEIRDLEPKDGLLAVESGAVEVAIVDEAAWSVHRQRHRLQARPALQDTLVVVLPLDHRLASREAVALDELASEAWVLEPEGEFFAELVVAACRRAGFEPPISAVVRDLGAALGLVQAGGVLTVLPRRALDASSFRVAAVELEPKLVRRMVAVTRAGRPLDRATDALVERMSAATSNAEPAMAGSTSRG